MSQIHSNRASWLKRFAEDCPVLFSVLVILAALLLTEIPLQNLFRASLGMPGANFLSGTILQFSAGALLVGLLAYLGLLQLAGFTAPRRWRALWLGWPLLILTLLNLLPLLDGTQIIDTSNLGLIALFVLLVLSVGFFEEALGRGVVLAVMLHKWGHTRRGIYAAVLVSSALFGLAHLINGIAGRLPLLPNLTQLLYSFFFAAIFAACVLRNQAIWPMMLMHAAFDFGGLLDELAVNGSQIPVANNSVEDTLVTLLLTLPLLLYALFILRKVEPGQSQGQPGDPNPGFPLPLPG